MLPKAGTVESFGVNFVPVLLKSKEEEKKHRYPQGDKRPKETFLNLKSARNSGWFSPHQKASLLLLLAQKSHQSKVIVTFVLRMPKPKLPVCVLLRKECRIVG